ncbi:MAG: alanine racemase [Oscillospiraceae bacterium]|nr:alanine racemase [Oscillospiraceae bacterium]
MCQSNHLEISRRALRRNAAAVCKAVGVPVIGVVKCDGYGVTIAEAAAAWADAGVTMFAVSRPEEALTLRKFGFQEDILLMSPVADEETLKRMIDANVILTVTGVENALFYSDSTGKYPIRVHVAVDTGMGRFGIRWTDTAQLEWLYALAGFSFEGIFSHFSCSFEEEYQHTEIQLRRFLSAVNALEAAGYNVGIRHIANSNAALRFTETRLDAVRIGSALVGRLLAPSPVMLESVHVCKARVADLKYLQPGDTTGYGSYCVLKHSAKAAVVALGREDGFGTTTLPDKLRLRDLAAYLLRVLRMWRSPPCVDFHGHKLPVLGRIGNQYTLFDATGVEIHPGDWVEWSGNLLLTSCERRFI